MGNGTIELVVHVAVRVGDILEETKTEYRVCRISGPLGIIPANLVQISLVVEEEHMRTDGRMNLTDP